MNFPPTLITQNDNVATWIVGVPEPHMADYTNLHRNSHTFVHNYSSFFHSFLGNFALISPMGTWHVIHHIGSKGSHIPTCLPFGNLSQSSYGHSSHREVQPNVLTAMWHLMWHTGKSFPQVAPCTFVKSLAMPGPCHLQGACTRRPT